MYYKTLQYVSRAFILYNNFTPPLTFQVLSEEITPTLTRLNEERSSYLEYQKVLRELDHLTKLHVAYQFVSAEKLSKESEQELAKLAEATNALRQRLREVRTVV